MVVRSAIRSADVELLEAAVWAELHGRFGLEAGDDLAVVQRWGKATVLASRAADAIAINRAIGFGFERPFDAEALSGIRDFFREHGKVRWFIECSPDASINKEMLAAAGGVIGGAQIKLVAHIGDLADLPSPRLHVEEATEADASCFMDLVGSQLGVPTNVRPGIVSTIGQPGWHFYFAVADNRPVAGAAMFTGGEGAWFGLAATSPAYRNCGAQSALLLLRRICDAREAGCRWVSAETTSEFLSPNPSLRNMKRLGSRDLYHRPWYRFQEDASRPSA